MPAPIVAPDPMVAADTAANNQLLSDTVGAVGRFGLAAAGAGASVRLLQEVLAANRATKQRKDLNLVSLPSPMKMAATPAPGLNPLGGPLYRDPLAPTEPSRVAGHRANNMAEIPWAWPAVGAAGVVGGLGAYSLLDSLLNARRKRDLKDEVDEAKGEFESALIGGVPGQMKTAALQELSLRYEEAVSDKPTKKAEWLGVGQGIYAGGLLAALGIGGAYGWQQAAKSDPTRVRAELARRRAASRLATEPVEVELAPTEMPAKVAFSVPDLKQVRNAVTTGGSAMSAAAGGALGTAAAGGAIGAAAGGLMAGKGKKGRGALLGLGVGAGAGLGAGLLSQHLARRAK